MLCSELLIESIKHIEDISVKDFIKYIKNINLLDISEKIDGANLWFGIDNDGKFYTSREGKGGKRYYSSDSWGSRFWETGFKSAHIALEKIVNNLKEANLLQPGDIVEVEILFGQLPNTVPYKGDMNQIIFLRPIDSKDGNIKDLEERLEKIKDLLENFVITVVVNKVPHTPDGKTIEYVSEVHKWRISKTPKIDKKILDQEYLKNSLNKKLKELEDFLYQKSDIGNFTNFEILTISLNKKPENISREEWKDLKDLIKAKREYIESKIYSMKLDIKEDLLNNLVRKTASKFGPSLEEGGWIEGIVFRDPETNQQFKVVDKDLFTEMKKFNWLIRNLLRSSAFSKKIGDFFGKFLHSLFKEIGREDLVNTRKLNNLLSDYLKNNIDPIKELSKNVDFKKTKNEWLKIVEHYLKLLNRIYNIYRKNKHKLIFRKEYGNTVKTSMYVGEIDYKTKQYFAEIFNKLKEFKENVQKAKNSEELISALLKDKLEIVNENLCLFEGGNIFPKAGAIHISEVKPTLMKFANLFNLDRREILDSVLGSTGKKEFSGDIDIVFDEKTVNIRKFIDNVKEKLGENSIKITKNQLSILFPIENFNTNIDSNNLKRTGFVQIDIMIGDKEWKKFYYYSPGEESKFKGAHRNLMIAEIAKNIVFYESDSKDSFGRPIKQVRLKYSPEKGLTKIERISEKNEKTGEWKKEQKDIELTKPTKDPKTIKNMLFGFNAPLNVLDSLENLIEGIKKYIPDKAENIFKSFAESVVKNKYLMNYDFPKEIKKYFRQGINEKYRRIVYYKNKPVYEIIGEDKENYYLVKILENATAGATSSGNIASVSIPLGSAGFDPSGEWRSIYSKKKKHLKYKPFVIKRIQER